MPELGDKRIELIALVSEQREAALAAAHVATEARLATKHRTIETTGGLADEAAAVRLGQAGGQQQHHEHGAGELEYELATRHLGGLVGCW